jgi:hypothetical protein
VFEDEKLNEKTVAAVEKQIHFGDNPEAPKSEHNPAVQTREAI